MSHLGERLTALVDGELGHDERDRALAHLAGCDQCRVEADKLRQVKNRLRALADASPDPLFGSDPDVPSSDFVARLNALGRGDGPVGPSGPVRRTEPRAMPRARVAPRPRDTRPAGRGAAAMARRMPRGRRLAVGAAAAVVLSFGTASYVAGANAEQSPQPVTPAFDKLEFAHSQVSGEVPLPEPATRP